METKQVPASVEQEQITKIVENCSRELTIEEKGKFKQLLLKYSHIFVGPNLQPGHTAMLTHTIDTSDSQPIRQGVRCVSPHQRRQIKELLNDMLSHNTIQPSKSPWASPIVLVKKKDGSTRFCVDYRKLNSVTRKDAYPLPRIDDTLDSLSGSQWFTVLVDTGR